jgi:nickel superoxide dismutase
MEGGYMRLLSRLLEPKTIVHAHCDLPCGVYDPAQARIEAESVKAIAEKYAQNTDPEFRARAIFIKEQRSELVKHHLWVLWTDYFKPPHFEKYPQLHQLFNEATKLAGAAGTKGSMDVGRTNCWPRSRRSTRSSGRPSRPKRHLPGGRIPGRTS